MCSRHQTLILSTSLTLVPLSQAWIDGGCLSRETILQGVSLTLHQNYMTCAASARQAAYAAPCAASSEPGMEGYAGDRSADLCSAIHGDYLRCEDDHTDDGVDETYGQACPCTCAGVSQWSPFVDGPWPAAGMDTLKESFVRWNPTRFMSLLRYQFDDFRIEIH